MAKEIKITKHGLHLLKRLAKNGNEGEFNFDGRDCRSLLRAGLVRVTRTKDGKRITGVSMLTKGRDYLDGLGLFGRKLTKAERALEDAADVAAATAAIAEPGANVIIKDACAVVAASADTNKAEGVSDPAAGPVAEPEPSGPSGVGC